METAIQVVAITLGVVAIILGGVTIGLSFYFYRMNTALYTSLTDIISRIEASSRATEVASKDIIKPIVETVQEIFQGIARGRIDSLRPTILQRSAAGLDEALRELPESEKRKAREAVYKEIDSFLGTIRQQLGIGPLVSEKEMVASTAEAIASKPVSIPGSVLYDWMPFIRRIRDFEVSHRFLSVKWLRETKFANEREMQETLQIAINMEMLLTYYVDNPKNPLFPTLACKLNWEHPVVREILQAIGE